MNAPAVQLPLATPAQRRRAVLEAIHHFDNIKSPAITEIMVAEFAVQRLAAVHRSAPPPERLRALVRKVFEQLWGPALKERSTKR